jgi:hypothetical protein
LYPLSFDDLYNWFFSFFLSLDLSFPPGVVRRPCNEPSQDDADKKGAQEHKSRWDRFLPWIKFNIDHLGILDGKDDNQDG